jgi:hypothetical protein
MIPIAVYHHSMLLKVTLIVEEPVEDRSFRTPSVLVLNFLRPQFLAAAQPCCRCQVVDPYFLLNSSKFHHTNICACINTLVQREHTSDRAKMFMLESFTVTKFKFTVRYLY